VISVAIPFGGCARGEPTVLQCIGQQGRTRQSNLPQSEQEDLRFYSVREGKLIDVEFARGFVTIIFDSALPGFSKQTEIAEDPLTKAHEHHDKAIFKRALRALVLSG